MPLRYIVRGSKHMSTPSTSSPAVTRADVVQALITVGVAPGDTVFAHSSLRAFGHVGGGADTVIDALMEAVGPAGTVVMPAFTWDSFHDKAGVVFDMVRTPSETGRITEVFRQRPGVVRSPHICHSVAAAGASAAEVTRDSPSVYAQGGPFDALLRLNAWNVFLGVSFGSCTALHMAEEQARVPYRQNRDFRDCRVIHPDGSATASASVEFLRKQGYWNDFSRVEAVFEREGVLREARVGAARILNIRMRDVVRIARRLLDEDIYWLLAAECRPGKA